ncbi:MAG: aldehyde dehydrogenase family protein [Bacteroidales bacterium]|jgi:acetaldehyde dehydrogenase/alcohol dehydrogenase|nr:aldehyde dehydrogenase family protein [Bacteroidales bacterium]
MAETLQEKADEVLSRAILAAAEFQQFNQEQTDRVVEAVYKAGLNARIILAKMAVEETGIGIWQHKVWKNVIATQLVYESIINEKTVGVISNDSVTGITEIAQPLGPIFAVTPVTNPTSTAMYKILICLKTRNPIIISAHRGAAKCTAEAARICYEAALEAGAPEDCIQVISAGSRDFTQTVMAHPKVALILATGGTGLVRAAYSSGNPAIGVGPGNVPVFIDESADIPFAVSSIISSKTFDNGTICASEQSIIVEEKIELQVREEFARQHCYFLPPDEIKKVEKVAVVEETMSMSPFIVGQSVETIANKAGITVPEGTRILMAKLDGVGKNYPLSHEVLAPILAFYVAKNYNQAIHLCIDLNYLGGIGHSAGIYANDEKRILEFSQVINAGRIVVNTPTSQGAVGGTYNLLVPSLTLGCGTGGKNITTENITAKNLINIQRVCRRKMNDKYMSVNQDMYLDENSTESMLQFEYHKNH